ncbi:MAG: GNAT family N-acetyltransferase, partial [Devosia sp.]
ETDRLVLSGWRRDQLGDLTRLHGDPVVAKYLKGHGQPWSMTEAEEALDEWMALFETRRLGKMRVTRKVDGVLVGRCGYGVYGPSAEPEIGYSLYPEFWGNGYAYEAASGMRDWLFRETDLPYFWGSADTRNAASLKILRRIGMTETHQEPDEGRMLQFHILRRPE